MDFSFYFEDSQGNIVNENGEDPMEIVEDEDPFKLEELTSYTEYIALRNTLRDSEMEQEPLKEKQKRGEKKFAMKRQAKKLKELELTTILKLVLARAVALSLKLEPRTVQRWYKTWKEDPDSLFKTIGRPRIIEPEGELAEATGNVVADLYFKQPTSTIDQLMDRLNSSFSELTISKRTLYRYMADLWIFSLKKVQLEPEERNAPEKIQARKEW
ncbi:hypothetical protein BDF14DRAFT_1694770, partial [Spinellus fusiger]